MLLLLIPAIVTINPRNFSHLSTPITHYVINKTMIKHLYFLTILTNDTVRFFQIILAFICNKHTGDSPHLMAALRIIRQTQEQAQWTDFCDNKKRVGPVLSQNWGADASSEVESGEKIQDETIKGCIFASEIKKIKR